MKIFNLPAKIFKKIKSKFVPRDIFFPDGKPLQIYKDGILTRYNQNGKVVFRKSEHECLSLTYDESGKIIKQSYTSTPKFFIRGSHTQLLDEFVKK